MLNFQIPLINEKEDNSIGLKYAKIINDSYSECVLDNSFLLFNTFNNLIYLIYATKNNSIITYNLISFQKMNEIKNAHEHIITNFRHYADNKKKRDLFLSLSNVENKIKVWNVNNFACFLVINNINKAGFLLSACFLNENNNNIFIITSNSYSKDNGPIKVFDLKGIQIKTIKDSKKQVFFIDSFYDKKSNKNYIITGNEDSSTSYDFEKNCFYHNYGSSNSAVPSILMYDNNEILQLIESNNDKNLRIYNFHSGILLRQIYISSQMIFGLCLSKINIY